MKKISCVLLMLGSFLFQLSAMAGSGNTEVLKNLAFKDNFAAWTVQAPAGTFQYKNGNLEVQAPQNGKHFLIQYGLPTAAGKYILSCEVQGNAGGTYAVYAEWAFRNSDSSESYGSTGSSAVTADGSWQYLERSFTITPEQAKTMSALYVAMYFDGQHKYKLRNLSLVKVAEAAPPSAELTELIQNGDFKKSLARWTNNSPGVFTVKNNVLCADVKEAGNAFLVQYDLPLSQGDYTLSYEIRGAADTKFYAYVEWNLDVGGNVVYGSSGAQAQPSPAEWQKMERKFSISAETASDMTALYAVFGFVGPGKFQLRNVSLKRINGAPKPVPPEPVAMFGGMWRFSGSSKVNNGGSEAEFELASSSALQNIPVKGGQYYRLSFRTKGLVSPDITNYCIFRTDLVFNNNAPEQPPVHDDTNVGWLQTKSLEFQVPANSDRLDFRVTVKSGALIRFDQFKLEAIPAPVDKGDLTLLEPAYRNRIYASMPCEQLKGKLRLPEGGRNASVELVSNGNVIAQAQVDADGIFSFDEIPPVGKYIVRAVFNDKNGDRIENTLDLEVASAQEGAMEVVMDADHNFRFNGEIFFPVAFWSIGLFSDEGFYYAARQGVNLIVYGGDDGTSDEATALQMLDDLHRFKMKIFFTTAMIRGTDEQARREYRENLERVFTERVRNHPAFFGYFTSDEPIWRGEPQAKIMAMYEILRDFDPNHPVWINSAPRNSLKEHAHYAKGADIYGVDIYPVPTPGEHSGLEDKELTCVGKYADFCRQAVYGRRAVWMCMQGFSWHTMYQGEDGSGYPTMDELRFMQYDSFVSGSNGATYWGPHHIKNLQFSSDLFAMARELRDRSALFVATEKLIPCQTDNPLMVVSQVELDGKTFAVAVNRSKEPLTATVSGDFPELTSLEDGTTTLTTGGKLTLAGYGVAVFGNGELPPPVNEMCPEIPEFERKDNPFARSIERNSIRTATIPYNGNAKWIWDERQIKGRGRVDLEQHFELDEAVVSAYLYIGVDNIAEVTLNGTVVDDFSSWNMMRKIDVKNLLAQGGNALQIHAENDFYLPCGLLVDLEITLASGKVVHIVSDENWQTADGNAVKIVANYGEGAWGKRVEMEK